MQPHWGHKTLVWTIQWSQGPSLHCPGRDDTLLRLMDDVISSTSLEPWGGGRREVSLSVFKQLIYLFIEKADLSICSGDFPG